MKQEGKRPIESPDTHNNNSKCLYFRLCQYASYKVLLKSFTFFSIESYSCSISCSGFYFVYPSSKRPAILPYILLKKYIVRENNSILQLINILQSFLLKSLFLFSSIKVQLYFVELCFFIALKKTSLDKQCKQPYAHHTCHAPEHITVHTTPSNTLQVLHPL